MTIETKKLQARNKTTQIKKKMNKKIMQRHFCKPLSLRINEIESRKNKYKIKNVKKNL